MTDRPALTRRPVRVLAVCSHNRTRSVMIAGFLDAMLTEWVGAQGHDVRSAGFGPGGLPAIAPAIDAMRRRGINVSSHASHQLTPFDVEVADLILTAERDHVVRIAALSPSSFDRTMTLPEFLVRAPQAAGFDAIVSDRTALAYLRDDVGEVADPTGSSVREFEDAVVRIEEQCREAAGWIAALGISPRAEPQ